MKLDIKHQGMTKDWFSDAWNVIRPGGTIDSAITNTYNQVKAGGTIDSAITNTFNQVQTVMNYVKPGGTLDLAITDTYSRTQIVLDTVKAGGVIDSAITNTYNRINSVSSQLNTLVTDKVNIVQNIVNDIKLKSDLIITEVTKSGTCYINQFDQYKNTIAGVGSYKYQISNGTLVNALKVTLTSLGLQQIFDVTFGVIESTYNFIFSCEPMISLSIILKTICDLFGITDLMNKLESLINSHNLIDVFSQSIKLLSPTPPSFIQVEKKSTQICDLTYDTIKPFPVYFIESCYNINMDDLLSINIQIKEAEVATALLYKLVKLIRKKLKDSLKQAFHGVSRNGLVDGFIEKAHSNLLMKILTWLEPFFMTIDYGLKFLTSKFGNCVNKCHSRKLDCLLSKSTM